MKSKIAFISAQASPLAITGEVGRGGQHVHVAELAKAIADMGYEVDIYTRRDSLDLDEIVYFYPHVRVINILAGPAKPIPKEESFMYMDEFADMMLDIITDYNIQYSLIHAHFWLSGHVAIRIKQELAIPFVVNFHGLGTVCKDHQAEAARFPAERLDVEDEITWHADQIIATCPNDMKDLIQYYHVDPLKVEIIPYGYNPNDFHPVARNVATTVAQLDPNKRYILQLGSIESQKGIDNVIRAFALLDDDFPDVRLLVVGGNRDNAANTEELERLATVANEWGIAGKIHFIGWQDRSVLKYYYNAAELFVTTPLYEPFGMTPLEAMACGTPVIGSNVGGVEYTVRHGDTGVLVEPQDPEQLAAAFRDLLTDGQLREAMSGAGIKHVSDHFTWEIVAEKIAVHYEKLICPKQANTLMKSQPLLVKNNLADAAALFKLMSDVLYLDVVEAAKAIVHALKNGRKILVCGDAASAAVGRHFVTVLVCPLREEKRPACAVISLDADVAAAWTSETDFVDVFARQVEALGGADDVLVCLSTEGTSDQITRVLRQARQQQMVCVNFLGHDGGHAATLGHHNLIVPSTDAARIQEMHLHLVHTMCELVGQDLSSFRRQDDTRELEGGIAV